MNLFRLVGDMTHLLSIVVLLLKIRTTKSCAGTFFLLILFFKIFIAFDSILCIPAFFWFVFCSIFDCPFVFLMLLSFLVCYTIDTQLECAKAYFYFSLFKKKKILKLQLKSQVPQLSTFPPFIYLLLYFYCFIFLEKKWEGDTLTYRILTDLLSSQSSFVLCSNLKVLFDVTVL